MALNEKNRISCMQDRMFQDEIRSKQYEGYKFKSTGRKKRNNKHI